MSTNTANLTNYHPRIPLRHIEDYADIINAQRPHAANPMPLTNRAAQFSPYAALVGHKDIIAADESIASGKINLDQEITIEPDYEYLENYEETD